MPNKASATTVHSLISPPAQACFPHSLTDVGPKSTSYQTTCLRISILASTSRETQTMIDTIYLNLILKNLSQIFYPLFYRLLHTKSSKISFFPILAYSYCFLKKSTGSSVHAIWHSIFKVHLYVLK